VLKDRDAIWESDINRVRYRTRNGMWKRRVRQTCGNVQQREGKREEERETVVATKGWNKSRRRRETEEESGREQEWLRG
jgi:hypothetical protein